MPIYRGGVSARVREGRLMMFGVATHPDLQISTTPAFSASDATWSAISQGPYPDADHVMDGARLVILPLEIDGKLSYHLTWEVRTRTDVPPGIWVSHLDAQTGELLNVYNEVRFLTGHLQAVHDLRTVDGQTTTSNVPLAMVYTSSNNRVYTDRAGVFELDEADGFNTELRGEYVRIFNEQGSDADAEFTGSDFTWTTSDADIAEIDSYIFLHQVQEWGLEFGPDVQMVTSRVDSHVNMDQTCNAYFDGDLNFFRAGSGCNNTGRMADVNYHEWGHGFHYYSLLAGDFDGSISEGIGDVVASLQTADPIIAPYFMTDGSGIRDISDVRVYPDDWVNEVHEDGLIFAGAVWDLWQIFRESYSDDEAHALTSTLFAQAIKAGPTVPESYDEFVLADDDDNNLGNGTPNQCDILEAFSAHGLGPSGMDTLLYVGHEALENQSATSTEYPVVADVTNLVPECFSFSLDSATIHYSIDGGESWQEAPLTVSGTDLDGAIPKQPDGSVVHYYIEASSTDGDVMYNPPGAAINPHSFFVGQLTTVRCDDFEDATGGDYTHVLVSGQSEAGADDWQLGTPNGDSTDPDYAWSGDNVWGNDLGRGNYDGNYQDNRFNRLSSPAIAVPPDAQQLVLQFRRWLSVEDGYYDHARVLVDGETMWTNHESSRREGDEHHLDKQYGLHTMAITDADADGFVTLSWEIESDGGLNYGGWNIDDVCVYAWEPTLVEPGDDTGGDSGDDGQVIDDTGAPKLAAPCGCTSTGTPGGLSAAAAVLALALSRRRR